MPLNFDTSPYGRRSETDYIFSRFDAGKNLLMPGPRRLGKTFVLERLEQRASQHNYHAIRLDVSSCADTQAFFKKLAEKIEDKLGNKILKQIKQRALQLGAPHQQNSQTLPQALLNVDWESYAGNLLKELAEDSRRWLILMDELPIFLLRLHERSAIDQASRVMYWLRENCLNLSIRWLFTGSIGFEPLARKGNYQGAMRDLEGFDLKPLEKSIAQTFVQDLAQNGLLPYRREITDSESCAIVDAVGWLSPYYLEAFSRHLQGVPTNDPAETQSLIEATRFSLFQSADKDCFSVWSEHIRKHYQDNAAKASKLLAALSESPNGASSGTLLADLANPNMQDTELKRLLAILEEDGFIVCDFEADTHRFRMELLRLWWQRYLPE